MTTWFTSDLHFGHKNIIKYSRRFLAVDPDRPTKQEVAAMDQLLIDNWNRVVQPTDVVWNLGDLAFCTSDEHAQKCLEQLSGTHELVPGNHDEIAKRLPFGHWNGEVVELEVEGQQIVLCHYAMREWHHALRGVWHLFGHTHGCLGPFGKSVDVGVDNAWRIITNGPIRCNGAESLRPVSFQELKAHMETLPIGPHAEFGHGFVPSTADPEAQVALWKACVICGNATPYACSDCMIDGIIENPLPVHVCSKMECQRKHEETCPGRKHHV